MDTNREVLTLGPVSDPAACGLPEWCRGYVIRRGTDGRIFAAGSREGCEIFVIPNRWRDATLNPAPKRDTATNYGVMMSEVHGKPAGVLTTNDPDFRPMVNTGVNVVPSASGVVPTPKELIVPGLLILVAALVVFARRRKG